MRAIMFLVLAAIQIPTDPNALHVHSAQPRLVLAHYAVSWPDSTIFLQWEVDDQGPGLHPFWEGRPGVTLAKVDASVCDDPFGFIEAYCMGYFIHDERVWGYGKDLLYEAYCGRAKQVKLVCRQEVCAEEACAPAE